jgi:hypothetical protein
MEQYIHAARWFPLSIDLFVSLGSVLHAGKMIESHGGLEDAAR